MSCRGVLSWRRKTDVVQHVVVQFCDENLIGMNYFVAVGPYSFYTRGAAQFSFAFILPSSIIMLSSSSSYLMRSTRLRIPRNGTRNRTRNGFSFRSAESALTKTISPSIIPRPFSSRPIARPSGTRVPGSDKRVLGALHRRVASPRGPGVGGDHGKSPVRLAALALHYAFQNPECALTKAVIMFSKQLALSTKERGLVKQHVIDVLHFYGRVTGGAGFPVVFEKESPEPSQSSGRCSDDGAVPLGRFRVTEYNLRNHSVDKWERVVQDCVELRERRITGEGMEEEYSDHLCLASLCSLPPAVAREWERTCPEPRRFAEHVSRSYPGPEISLRATWDCSEGERVWLAKRLRRELREYFGDSLVPTKYSQTSDHAVGSGFVENEHLHHEQDCRSSREQEDAINNRDVRLETISGDQHHRAEEVHAPEKEQEVPIFGVGAGAGSAKTKSNEAVYLQTQTATGLRVKRGLRLDALPSFRAGLIEVQDEACIRFVERLKDLIQGDFGGGFGKKSYRVLDFCAGAGGKALALASLFSEKTRFGAVIPNIPSSQHHETKPHVAITAHDIRDAPLTELRERAARAQLSDMIDVVGSSELQRRHPMLISDPDPPERAGMSGAAAGKGKNTSFQDEDRYFDLVIVDAPCSNSGRLVRDPGVRVELLKQNFQELRELQDTVLRRGAA